MSDSSRGILNRLKTQDVSSLSPVYFFYGGEEFLKDKAVALITKTAVEPSTKEFNYNLYHIPETDIGTVLYAANSLPFLAEKRLVIVKNIGKMPAAQDELFESYLNNPSPSTCLVLVGGDKLPKRKIFDKIENKYPSANFYNLFERDIPGYISEFVSQGKKNISHEAAELLCELVGRNMLEIKNEADKLILYSGAKTDITAEDVEKCCGTFKINTGYDLIPLIARKETRKAVKLLLKILSDGEDGIKILSAISDKFKQYHRFYGIISRGADEYTALAQAGVRFYKDAFLRDARDFSPEQIKTGLRLILNSELKMKSGGNPEIELEKLLFNLCQPRHKAGNFS